MEPMVVAPGKLWNNRDLGVSLILCVVEFLAKAPSVISVFKFGLAFIVLFGLPGALATGLFGRPTFWATVRWGTSNKLPKGWGAKRGQWVSLSVGAIVGLIGGSVGLIGGPMNALFLGLAFGVAGATIGGLVLWIGRRIENALVVAPIQESPKPNKGTWQSGKFGLFIMLGVQIVGTVFLILVVLPLWRLAAKEWVAGLAAVTASIILTQVASMLGLSKGGGFFLGYWVFRFRLFRTGRAPFRLDRFLEQSAHRHLFLQRYGGGYRFVHDVIREYFASPASGEDVEPDISP